MKIAHLDITIHLHCFASLHNNPFPIYSKFTDARDWAYNPGSRLAAAQQSESLCFVLFLFNRQVCAQLETDWP